MNEAELKRTQQAIAERESALADAKDTLDRLKAAGENVFDLESKYNAAAARLQRFKDAFKTK